MNREKLKDLYLKYELTEDHIFKHKHYTIISREGIEKIQAIEKIKVTFEVVRCEPNYCVFKAVTNMLETFGSAIKGNSSSGGNCQTWYVAEMAEKRALSRAVLKQTGFYEHKHYGEDEIEEFKRDTNG